MCPTVSRQMDITRVLQPRRAEAKAASQPAWPAPIIITSYFSAISASFFLINRRGAASQAFDPVAGGDLLEFRRESAAGGLRLGAVGLESTKGPKRFCRGLSSLGLPFRRTTRVEQRDRFEQRPCVRVNRVSEKLAGPCKFYDLPEVHDRHAVAEYGAQPKDRGR